MGKRAKKKVQSAPGKLVSGSRIASSSPSSVTSSPADSGRSGEKCNGSVETGCLHGANIDKLRTQLSKSSAIHCLECAKLRSGPAGGKDRRVKGKPVKKKVHNPSAVSPSPEEKSNSHKLWICLSCGHAGCGHLGSPGTNNSEKLVAKQGIVGRGHAWQHWLQLKHPMVMQCGDEFACWCFQCEAAHEHKPSDMEIEKPSEDEVDASVSPSRVELLHQSAKLVRKKLAEQVVEVKELSVDGADQEEGNVQSLTGPENGVVEDGEAGKPKRIIKGLMNLGNTCFFNSVMQNLLGVEVLRNHFLVESANFEGPLTTSLRKFFQEIAVLPPGETVGMNGLEGGLKRGAKARGGWSGMDGVHNPKGLFGAICSKVPRFKGYQQQDSHELLKCLLDGLHTEEETARKLFPTASSKAENRDNGVLANGDEREHSGVLSAPENGPDGLDKKKQVTSETFVERVFGGQLSSTVSCCECGHSSVVYEPFLDLSLSIPVRSSPKQPPPLQSVTEQATMRVLSKNQRTQSFKSKNAELTVKTGGRSDMHDDVLNSSSSQIAGLGTPLLLLPPPPPKESNVDNLTLSTVSDDTSWLEFLGGEEDLEPQITFGCAPNPDEYLSVGCASNPNFQMGSVYLEDGAYTTQAGSSEADASMHALDAHRFTEVGDVNGLDGSFGTTIISVDHSLEPLPCEKLLLLEAPRQSWSETHIHSHWFESERSNYESSDGPEENGYIQIRGGSDSQVLLLTQGNDTGFFSPELIADNSSNLGTSAEQSGNCGDDSKLHSEFVTGPSGAGLSLDSTTGDGDVCTTLEAQGDYDGVASLFDEEDNTEYPMHGPFPLNHDASGYEGSSGFEEVGLDDVLDLGKINCEGRDDWLVCANDRQEVDSEEVTVSLEGCLQIFTRPEVLSGDNAWGCENCTNKYHENLAAALVRKSVTFPQKDPVKRIAKKGRFEPGNSASDVSDLDSLAGDMSVKLSRSEEDLRVDHEDKGVREDAASDHTYKSDFSLDKGAKCNGTGTGIVTVKMYATEDVQSLGAQKTRTCTAGEPPASCGNDHSLVSSGVEEQGGDSLQDVGFENTGQVNIRFDSVTTVQENGDHPSVHLTSEPMRLLDAGKNCLSNGSVITIVHGKDASGDQSSNPSDCVESGECDVEKSEAEVSTGGQPEKVVSSSSSCRTLKLTKTRSKKVVAEPRKIIKQEATKRYLISKAPPVLVVQLKRFARDMRGRLSKLYGSVTFQEWLDLHPYVDHRHVTSQNCRYRLTGTVEHTGTLKGGHYVAYVRGPPAPTAPGLKHDPTGESSWYHISDSYVRQTSLDAVLKSEAYLLFYERC
ncbi:ubiquitin carboxyl-terminal hydrolase 16/45 [Marchantia polymorpha subsp. ruderalis]|uniref:Uncharacterized protein n=2 Tax=Marchantia polymorpha TaxID=3197 RepID=A0A176VIM7_MARPO|nr:hypothetical protein AXG93_4010s1000 [Marchantia polymorpha subsp. ruderalis]PTQ30551.1 hypothetical protein MARPO_0123s0038 [Marchantia polymorpha]BBN17728.1 hypothetical protein Mp_7g16560 [Marchantia polymorpha subsp. ruderalis]|eukprot:PTQ30551.1 hypothetical protein MARPO_0123s0038 [Marchantia polymorpha]